MPGAAVADVPPQLVMVVQGDDPQEPPLPLIDLDALTSGSESSEIAFGEDDTSTNVDSGDSNNPSPMFSTSPSDAEIIESWSADFHLAVEFVVSPAAERIPHRYLVFWCARVY